LEVKSFYDVGVTSSVLHNFKCSSLSNDVFFIPINEVRIKCFKMPFWDCTSIDSSSDEKNHSQNKKCIIASIIHRLRSLCTLARCEHHSVFIAHRISNEERAMLSALKPSKRTQP